MTRQQLAEQIFNKKTYLCVGLDTDLAKIPVHLRSRPQAMVEFNKAIIDATLNHCVGYKINTAFYEALGVKGWIAMEETVNYIPSSHFKIADAKRGDIGNTSQQYARAFFEAMNFDAITVAPYMGEDSVRPFLEYEDKWTILLGLTSNPGAHDFEIQKLSGEPGQFLYERVIKTAASWGNTGNLMFVIGATRAGQFDQIRSISPEHFYLVPGVGAQGGSLKEISEKALIKDCGLLVNASRAVIYASAGEDFAEKAEKAAADYHNEMKNYL
jgi:orotidine-5'-phosphate decarboxylase